MTKLLTAQEILQAQDLRRDVFTSEKWGGSILVQEMCEQDIAEFMSGPDQHTRFIARCCINEDGSRLFTDEEVEGLRKKNRKEVARLFKFCLKVNGMDEESVEAIEKKFEPSLGDASTSD